jgi:transposase
VILGIDLACRAEHRASLADEDGRFLWRSRAFRSTRAELDALTHAVGSCGKLIVVLEPTRNAWVPVAAHFKARGAKVVVVPPERAADLRRYYSKHTKNDKLDSQLLARIPLLHPDGLITIDDLGPARALKRAVRRRANLINDRTASHNRIDALLELFSPAYAAALGAGDYCKAALALLERYSDPEDLLRLGKAHLTGILARLTRGRWKEAKADQLLAAAREVVALWQDGGLDFEELAWDVASEVRVARRIEQEIAHLDARIEALYAEADPDGVMVSAPGVGTTLAAGILGRLGDANRFANLAGVRSFSGMVPRNDQSGLSEGKCALTKAGDPGLRRDLFLAADKARCVDPQLAMRYHRLVVERGLTHISAVCHISTTLLTRMAACWRTGQAYVIRDVDGRVISEAEGRAFCKQRYAIPPEVKQAWRRARRAQVIKQRTGRRSKESTLVAPAFDPPRESLRKEPINA